MGFPPAPVISSVDADQDIIHLQSHVCIELAREEYIYIDSGSNDPKGPEQFILPNFEDYIEDSCNSAEDFQPHMLKPEIDLYQIISGCLGEVG